LAKNPLKESNLLEQAKKNKSLRFLIDKDSIAHKKFNQEFQHYKSNSMR
jgi:hypothetical protein